jgi:molybdopterin/thiamine biosynthesis adenylyltransferase
MLEKSEVIYRSIFMKNIGPISLEEQEKLSKSNVAIIGCGGIGGRAFELLVRSGIGNITIIDKDVYEPSNLNRQAFSSYEFIGIPKVNIAKKFALSINPTINVNAVCSEFNEKNAVQLLKGKDVVIDGLDSAFSRIILSRKARELRIPYVFGAAEKTRGISTVFMPNSQNSRMYEEIFRLPSKGKRLDKKLKERLEALQRCESVLGVVPNLIGTFEAMQTLNLLLNKPIVKSPYFFHVDMFSKVPVWIGKL